MVHCSERVESGFDLARLITIILLERFLVSVPVGWAARCEREREREGRRGLPLVTKNHIANDYL